MPEFFGSRYRSKALRIASAAIIFVFLIPYTASVYNGLSRLFGMAFGLPYDVCVIGMAVVTCIYVVVGGYMATVMNDFIQGIVMLLGIVAVIVAVLVWFTGKTKKGKAMRACSEDKGAAQLMGINVNGTISLTFAIGSGLAAIAGVLLCSAYPTLVPTTGAMPGIKAFTAAVFGGIGSIPGAMVGGILLGIIEIFAKAYISTQLSDAIVFAVLIVVLVVRPAGLLGKQIREKV